jgi:hypothetical protein
MKNVIAINNTINNTPLSLGFMNETYLTEAVFGKVLPSSPPTPIGAIAPAASVAMLGAAA